MNYELKLGDNAETLKQYPDNYFDSIVTDPPYGIEFLGKDWDKNTGVMETWNECFRVLKPGGHILAFSAARTYHNLATNIELVGFEIRDQIMWLYGSGFPKAKDIGKAIDKREIENDWHGWKTALKPAHEPIVMARKPFKRTAIDNVLKHGVGALNIDESRVGDEEITTSYNPAIKGKMAHGYTPEDNKTHKLEPHTGRYPSNVIGEVPEYQKFFYCPKVSRKERHIGFNVQKQPVEKAFGEYTQDGTLGRMKDAMSKGADGSGSGAGTRTQWEYCGTCEKTFNGTNDHSSCDPDNKKIRYQSSVGNNHPTVKPVELMKYLVKLVTPAGGKVLDPFNGSGSTGMACVELDYEYTGCELDPEYIEIATKRIEGWYEHTRPKNNYDELFDE